MSCDTGEWEVGKEVKEKLAELGAKSLKNEVRFPSLNVCLLESGFGDEPSIISNVQAFCVIHLPTVHGDSIHHPPVCLPTN